MGFPMKSSKSSRGKNPASCWTCSTRVYAWACSAGGGKSNASSFWTKARDSPSRRRHSGHCSGLCRLQFGTVEGHTECPRSVSSTGVLRNVLEDYLRDQVLRYDTTIPLRGREQSHVRGCTRVGNRSRYVESPLWRPSVPVDASWLAASRLHRWLSRPDLRKA